MSSDVPVGRELDALVAERVMGWKWMPLDKHFHRTECAVDDGVIASAHLRDDSVLRADTHVGPYCSPPPRYSTDIAAAWEVLEHVSSPPAGCDADDDIYESVEVYRDPVGTWTCRIPCGVIGPEAHWGHEDTAAAAICRAALAWAARKS